MKKATGAGFTFSDVIPIRTPSDNMGDTSMPGVTGFTQFDAKCRDCDTEFTATPSEKADPGTYRDLGTGIRLTCPSCKQQKEIGKREVLASLRDA